MKQLKIYEYQAKMIEDTLRKLNNVYNCTELESALGRDFIQSWETIKSVLNETPDNVSFRCNCGHCKQIDND